MEIRGMKIDGFDAVRVRNALRAFLQQDGQTVFENGKFKIERKTLKADFLATELAISSDDGAALLAALVAEGFIDKDKLTPTARGMALTQAEDRERLLLDQARNLLDRFLKGVRTANARQGARILIERVHVFGSYLTATETVGDIDLLIDAPLPNDCQAEDMDERDAVLKEIGISEYLSFHDELDVVAANAEKCVVYDRTNPI